MPELGKDAFAGCNNITIVYVPYSWKSGSPTLPGIDGNFTEIQPGSGIWVRGNSGAKNLNIQLATIGETTFTYNGEEQYPSLTFGDRALIKGVDYNLEVISENGDGTRAGIDAGIVTVLIEGIGDFKATRDITYTIHKRPVTVKADDKTMTVGGSLPEFTYTVEGELEGEEALVGVPVISSPSANTSAAGSYDIEVDLSEVSYTANYTAD